jgi:hypothetical protein
MAEGMSNSHRVVMYGRTACHLCDEARGVILAARDRGARFGFEEVTIDGNPDLERDYGFRVPVVEVDGREEFEIAVEPARLRRLVG